MKLLGSTKNIADKDKNSENVPKLESVEVVLVNTEFSSVEVWFIDQSSKPLEIKDNVNLTLIIG